MYRGAIALAGFCLAAGSVALAADVAGAKDPLGFKRYEGSQIVHHAEVGYGEYRLLRGSRWSKTETVEGAIARVVYLVPAGHTPLELLRNYQQMLTEAGFRQTFELKSADVAIIKSSFCQYTYYGFETYDASTPGPLYRYCTSADNTNYATYKGTRDGKDISVMIMASEAGADLQWQEPGTKTPYAVKKGQTVIGVDVITSKAVENKMVLVKAADIADALASKGSIALYGIYFDVDKTVLKSDSDKTLDEVATLLKIDRALRLEISGHTDNTGGAAHNLALSEGRAKAVVDALVKKYGIDAARLQAKGFGDTKPVAPNDSEKGRAKNRRVELRKI